jgi:TPP-dependent pyruvate/acetoin dehydrogenase alpha subunit
MDVLAVTEAASQAVERVRETGAPWFLECMTYRFRPHSMIDPELYRDKTEVERWRERDPIVTFPRQMSGLITADDLASLEAEAAAELARACAFAEASPPEPVEDLLLHLRAQP